MQQYYASYDYDSIRAVETDRDAALALGEQVEGAGIQRVATIDSELATDILNNGWDPERRSFEIFDGEIIEITPRNAFGM